MSDDVSYAFFYLDGREFGIEVDSVRETINYQPDLIHMPGSSEIVEGLINLRGAVIPIINLRKRFDIVDAPEAKKEQCIAITRFRGHLFGLVFDEISEVGRIQEPDLRAIDASEEESELCGSHILLIDDGTRMVQLLDLERLFQSYHLPRIDNAEEESHRIVRPKKQNITFYLDGQEYALNVEDIHEIINVPEIQCKVTVDPAIKGVINLRGELDSVVDLRVCFGLASVPMNEKARIILLQGDLACGILVDAIHEVVHFDEEQCLPIPSFERRDCFAGIIALEAGRNVIQINSALLFSDDLKRQIKGNLNLHTEYQDGDADVCDEGQELSVAGQVLISFCLEQVYAFNILLFQEIIEYSEEIIPLPGRRAYFEGVLNLRGTAVPIINLRKYFGMEPHASVQECKIIILRVGGESIGIMVDSILEIIKAEQADLVHVPLLGEYEGHGIRRSYVTDAFRHHLESGEERLLLICDIQNLISEMKVNGLNAPECVEEMSM